jgi:hypothetical protein
VFKKSFNILTINQVQFVCFKRSPHKKINPVFPFFAGYLSKTADVFTMKRLIFSLYDWI